MPVAKWKGQVLAKADDNEVERVEGNIYFPKSAINDDYFINSAHKTICPWKGKASYYHIEVKGQKNKNAAWVYRNPSEAASHIKGYVAFWKGIEVSS